MASNLKESLDHMDGLFASYKIADALEFATDLYIAKGERDPAFIARFARASHDAACETEDKKVRRPLFERAIEAVTEALSKEEAFKEDTLTVAALHKWKGIILGLMGDIVSTKEKVGNAHIIYSAFEKSLALNPNDHLTQFAMAKWCWSVCMISFLERKAAELLFGAPPTSSLDDCERFLKAAWALNSTNCTIIPLLLGDVCAYNKDKAGAKEWFERAAAQQPPVCAYYRAAADEAKSKAAKLK